MDGKWAGKVGDERNGASGSGCVHLGWSSSIDQMLVLFFLAVSAAMFSIHLAKFCFSLKEKTIWGSFD